MKRGIFSIILATALVLTLGVMPAVAAPTSISFVGLSAGDPVEGLGVLADDLELTHSGGQTLVVIETDNDTDSFVYSANLGSQNDTPHGGLPDGIGFGDPDRDDPILGWYATFNGKTVKWFSVTMYDYGDWFPHGTTASMTHTAKLIAYDADDSIIDEDVLTFTSTGGGSTGRISPEFGALSSAGDALQATDGNTQPGIWTFEVAASGTSKVEMWFDGQKSVDPGVGWAGLEFELEVYDICGFKYADWEGDLIPLSGWNITLEKWDGADWIAIDWVETDTDGKYCFTDLEAGTYRVSEFLKYGWEQVYPNPDEPVEGTHIVVIPGGETYAEEATILYGTQRNNPGNNGLYEIDLDAGIATRLFNAGGSGNSPNGLGFDPENRRLYYMKVKESMPYYSHLYFYDIEAGTETHAGLDLTGEVVVGASFYDGSYYYIPNLTADLHKVTLNADGTVDEDILFWPNFNGAHDAVYRFGDFAISRGGMLYASTNDTGGSTAEFFKLDVATGEYTLIADSTTPGAALLLQVSFGSDGTLYGHSAGTGEFFTIDLQTGVRTSIGYVESDLRTRELFSDLASGTQPKYYDFVNTPEVHCEGQTAWAADPHPGYTIFSNANNWATYVGYTKGDGTALAPKAYPLYAGQHYLAGMLYVWDDGNTLWVNYSTVIPEGILTHYLDEGGKIYQAEGLCAGDWTGFLEYHLHVAEDEDGIPRTRTGRNRVLSNPIPGHFEYDGYFDPAEDETGWVQVDISGLDDDFVIAAHAVMQWCGYDCEALEEIEANLQP